MFTFNCYNEVYYKKTKHIRIQIKKISQLIISGEYDMIIKIWIFERLYF